MACNLLALSSTRPDFKVIRTGGRSEVLSKEKKKGIINFKKIITSNFILLLLTNFFNDIVFSIRVNAKKK